MKSSGCFVLSSSYLFHNYWSVSNSWGVIKTMRCPKNFSVTFLETRTVLVPLDVYDVVLECRVKNGMFEQGGV
jgi:hypothetical protein